MHSTYHCKPRNVKNQSRETPSRKVLEGCDKEEDLSL